MSFELKINIQDKEIQQKLKELQSKITNTKPFLKQIGYALIEQVEDNFENDGFFGKEWKLPKRCEKNKKDENDTKQCSVLQLTGRLASSIDFEVNNNTLTLGTNVEYAPIHQFGGKAGRNKKSIIDARPFLPIIKRGSDYNLHEKSEKEIDRVLDNFLKKL